MEKTGIENILGVIHITLYQHWQDIDCRYSCRTNVQNICIEREKIAVFFIAGTDDEEEEVVKPSHCQLPPALPVISPLPPLLQDSVAVIGAGHVKRTW